jgi:hypothetical protein
MSAEDERSLEDWIAFARVDAERRGLPELKPLLGGLLAAVRELRAADWNDDFSANAGPVSAAPVSANAKPSPGASSAS